MRGEVRPSMDPFGTRFLQFGKNENKNITQTTPAPKPIQNSVQNESVQGV